MKVGIGKLGKSTRFTQRYWKAIGGDYESPIFITELCKCYPEHEFVMVCRSDLYMYEGYETDLPTNLIDGVISKGDDTEINWDICFDIEYFIIINGPTGRVNIPNQTTNQDGSFKQCWTIFRLYVGITFELMNTLKDVPVIVITPDERYFPIQACDLKSTDLRCYGQREFEGERGIFLEDTEQSCTYFPIKQSYIPFETLIYRINQPNEELYNKEKTKELGILLNEFDHKTGIRRWYIEQVMEHYGIGFDLYGKWKDAFTDWVQLLDFAEIPRVMSDYKYTIMIPHESGQVTPKFYELVSLGIIPFFYNYDLYRNVVDYPEFLRCRNMEEVTKKIELINNDENLYNELRELLKKYYSEEYSSGNYFFNEFDKIFVF